MEIRRASSEELQRKVEKLRGVQKDVYDCLADGPLTRRQIMQELQVEGDQRRIKRGPDGKVRTTAGKRWRVLGVLSELSDEIRTRREGGNRVQIDRSLIGVAIVRGEVEDPEDRRAFYQALREEKLVEEGCLGKKRVYPGRKARELIKEMKRKEKDEVYREGRKFLDRLRGALSKSDSP